MRLIDADAFEQDLKEKLLPLLVEKYGKEEAMNGLHFSLQDCISNIQGQPTITQPDPEWIPFKTRPLTDEEREEHPEWDCIIVGPLPDDGQRILVSINLKGHEEVQSDEFYSDDGSYLDSGYEIGSEAVAWMPLPEPYKEGERDD